MKNYKTIASKLNVFLIIVVLSLFWILQISGAIAAPTEQGQDLALVTSPTNNAVVRGVVEIQGSADHPQFQFYKVEFAPEPVTGDQWQIIGDLHDQPVINGILETWDTTPYPDGSYTLRLQVVKLDGNYNEVFIQQVVISNSQPIPTDTPENRDTPTPTVTPTQVPPPPPIVIDQPVVETPTPRPVETSAPLENPEESGSFIPEVSGFSLAPLRDTCLYGMALMMGVFLFFGFLMALRTVIKGLMERLRRR